MKSGENYVFNMRDYPFSQTLPLLQHLHVYIDMGFIVDLIQGVGMGKCNQSECPLQTREAFDQLPPIQILIRRIGLYSDSEQYSTRL